MVLYSHLLGTQTAWGEYVVRLESFYLHGIDSIPYMFRGTYNLFYKALAHQAIGALKDLYE